jgi:Formate hydrogenlyase subunit 6/NADH:ubiquinone oxidoreductase 23 kD subunit (chain I)
MFGKGLLKGLGITFKHTFERELTQQYPEQRPFLQDRFRGCLAFDFPKCIACGLCTKTCPNNVLSLELVKAEGAKKKQLQSYTIDLQYCLFCNLCVEVCPTNTLYFTHDFELSKYNRNDIKIVYHRPAELDPVQANETPSLQSEANAPDNAETDEKRLKQIEAMKTVLSKNPAKTLAKVLNSEEDIEIMSSLLGRDSKKADKLAELLVDDREKAAKLAQAWVNKEKKDRSQEGVEQG